MRSLVALVVLVVAAAGCGSSSSCLPSLATATPCPAGVFVDASTTDPICLSAGGLPLCRGGDDAVCYMCTGGDFPDNCIIQDKQAGMTTECVHRCSLC